MATTTTATTAPPQQPRLPTTVTHTTSTTSIPPAITTLTNAFLTDPIFNFFLNSTSSSSRSWAIERVLSLTLHLASTNRGEIYEAHVSTPSTAPHQTSALIFPPHHSLDNLPLSALWTVLYHGFLPLLWTTGIATLGRFQKEYVQPVMKAKLSVFHAKETPYYYLSHIGTLDTARGRGLAPALIRDLQERAQKEGLPIWLESSSQGSRKVYLRCGFVDVEVDGEVGVRMGVGICDESGEKAEGAEAKGVTFYPMVWWPAGYVRGVGEAKKVL